jgi:cobalt/nickel transport protein
MEKWVLGMLVICLVIAGVFSLFASPDPDGLERVAEDQGFIEAGEGHEVIESPMPDYAVPGIENEALAGSLAGIVGVVLMYGLVSWVSSVLCSQDSKLPTQPRLETDD